ncbi:MAG: tetratricopeptide repeat protein [Planctomycetes bacterium]|nr:tetratricopeptide repeat protein [Planctomycetota bacterium]
MSLTLLLRIIKLLMARRAYYCAAVLLAILCLTAAKAAAAPVSQGPSTLLARAIMEQHEGHCAAALTDVQKAIHIGNVSPAAINLLIAMARQQHHPGRAYLLVADLGSRHLLSPVRARQIIAALIRHGPVSKLPRTLILGREHSGYGTQRQWAWRDYLLGAAAADCGRYRLASNFLQAAITAKPDFWPAIELFADQLATLYQFKEAETLLRMACDQPGHRRQAYRDLIAVYVAQDRLRHALVLAQEAAAKYKTDPEMQLQLARIYVLRQQINMAIMVLTGVWRRFPHFKPAYFMLLDLAQSNGDSDLLLKVSQLYIRRFPGAVFSKILQSRLAAQRGHTVLARRILIQALHNHPANIELWQARIALALAGHQVVLAQDLARQAIVLNPASLVLNDTLVQLLTNKPKQALTAARMFAWRHDQSPEAQQMYVQALLEFKRYVQCRAFLQPLTLRYPKARWIAQSWADYLDAAHDFKTEQTFLARITSGPAPRVADLLLLATVDYQLHDLAGEEATYRKVLHLEPQNSMAANDLGYTLTITKQQLPYARKIIEIAVKNHPGDAASRDSLGWVLYQQGHYRQALAQLKQAVRLPGGQSPEGLEHLGAVLNKLGHPGRAILIWKLALGQIPDSLHLSPHQRVIKNRIKARIRKAKLWLNIQKSGRKMM